MTGATSRRRRTPLDSWTAGHGIARGLGTAVVLSPHQNNFAMSLTCDAFPLDLPAGHVAGAKHRPAPAPGEVGRIAR